MKQSTRIACGHPGRDFKSYDKQSQSTSQTLNMLPRCTSMDINIYNSQQSTQQQLLTHTLMHCNMEMLEGQLDKIGTLASKQFVNRKNNNIIQCQPILNQESQQHCQNSKQNNILCQYSQSISSMQDQLRNSILKVQQFRRQAASKLHNYVLLKSKETNRKQIIKANILKQKQVLILVKQLRDKINNNLTNQDELNMYRERLKTSGLVFVAGLIQNGLISYVRRSIYDNKCQVDIKYQDNLRMIVEVFMGREDLLQLSICEGRETEIDKKSKRIEQVLYAKTRQYLMLKRYINRRHISICTLLEQTSQDNRYLLDRLCQQNILRYLKQNTGQISLTQLSKVRSLAQSDQLINQFLIHESKIRMQKVLVQVLSFIQALKVRSSAFDMQLVQRLLAQNKKINCAQKIQVPTECSVYLTQQQSTNKILQNQHIYTILQIIEDNQFLFNSFQSEFKLSVSSKQLKYLVIIQSIKCLIVPIVKLSFGMKANLCKDEKQKHYHYCRQIYMHVWAYRTLLGEDTVRKIMRIVRDLKLDVEQLKCDRQHQGDILCEQQSSDDPKKDKKQQNKKKQTNKKVNKQKDASCNSQELSLSQLFIQYNECYGQTYLYLINKLINIQQGSLHQHCPIRARSRLQENENASTKYKVSTQQAQRLIELWIQLVAEQVTEHQLNEMQPANVLKGVDFMQTNIVQQIDSKHKIQNQFMELQQLIAHMLTQKRDHHKSGFSSILTSKIKKQNKLQFNQSQKQQIYRNLMLYNLRTRNYSKLLQISKIIGVQHQIKLTHQQMYNQMYKRILL